MEKLSIKQKLELEILVKKTKSKHFILSTLENKNKNYFVTKIITLPFFKTLENKNIKFPLYLHALKSKSESLKAIKKQKANLVILDNFILKKKTTQCLFITEDKIISLLKEITSNTKRGNLP